MTELDLTKHYFDEKAGNWDSNNSWQKEQRLYEIFTERIPELRSPLLDMGSGTGVLVPVIERTMQEPQHIIEFDISLEMIRKSWKRHCSKNFMSFVQSDSHFLPFKNNSIASVLCFAVLPHFYDQKKAIKQMYRVLKKNGLLVILHLMGHRQLNTMHQEAGQAVCRHALQSVDSVSKQITALSFNIVDSCEQEDLYFIVAQK